MSNEQHIPVPDYTEAASPEPQASRLSRLAHFAGILGRKNSNMVDASELQIEPTADLLTVDQTTESENSDDVITNWTVTMEREAQEVSEALVANNAAVEKSWSLLTKVYEYRRQGHDWLQDEELVRRGIDRHYGTQQELYEKERKLTNLVHRRTLQVDYAKSYNTILEFTDEIDPQVYERYIPKPNQLGEAFNLPRTTTPTKDPEEAAKQLQALPFVNKHELIQEHSERPSIMLKGHFDFPAERIIGVESFNSWAGDGEMTYYNQHVGGIVTPNGKGAKSFTPLALPDVERTSRGAITDYAQQDLKNLRDRSDNAEILIFQDADGEYWGMAMNDGSHRVAAAKLRGEPTIAVSEINIKADQDMPRVAFSVKERAAEEKLQLS